MVPLVWLVNCRKGLPGVRRGGRQNKTRRETEQTSLELNVLKHLAAVQRCDLSSPRFCFGSESQKVKFFKIENVIVSATRFGVSISCPVFWEDVPLPCSGPFQPLPFSVCRHQSFRSHSPKLFLSHGHIAVTFLLVSLPAALTRSGRCPPARL